MGGFITQGLAGLAHYVLGGGTTSPNPSSPNSLFRKFLAHAESQDSNLLTDYLEWLQRLLKVSSQ